MVVHTPVIYIPNKANLRDLIAATGLVMLLKLSSNRRFFGPCDLDIWRMTSKNNRAPLLYYGQALCINSKPSENSNYIYSPETLNSSQNQRFFLSRVTFKFDRWPWKTIGYLLYATSSF